MYPRIAAFLGYCPYRPPRSFGELLFLHRAYRGLSKEKMARFLGVHTETLSAWEDGTQCPTPVSMEKVTGILRMFESADPCGCASRPVAARLLGVDR